MGTYKAPVPTPKAKVPKTPKAEPKPKLDFAEGAAVMARWPGSSLFFKAKVTLVREEEQEYDVEFENGTVYTLKGKDVYKADSKVMKKAPTRARSKSRGRGRPKAKEVVDAPAAEAPAEKTEEPKAEAATDAAVDEAPKVVPTPKPKKEKPVVTPSRVSRRLAEKAVTDAI